MDEDDAGTASAPGLDRLTAYTYLTVPDRMTYLAVMRIFTATLLTDLSAGDVAERLPGSGARARRELYAPMIAELLS